MIRYITEMTITSIILYWVILHATEFSAVANASSNALVGSVSALRGQ